MVKKINEKLESKKLSESSNRDKFLDWHENADNYNKYPEKFDKVYKILDKYGTENDPVDDLFDKASDEDRSAIMGIISESSELKESDYDYNEDSEEDRTLYDAVSTYLASDFCKKFGININIASQFSVFEDIMSGLIKMIKQYKGYINTESVNGKLNEDYGSKAKGRQVWTVFADIMFPDGMNITRELGETGKVYNAVSRALESVGCVMAGDYMSPEYDQTKLYADNEFFDNIDEYQESVKMTELFDVSPNVNLSLDASGSSVGFLGGTAGDVANEDVNLDEGYGEGLNTSDLSRIRDKIDELIELMDDEEVETIQPSPNTYRIGVPFIGTYEGYVDLKDIYQYVGGEVE